MLINITIFKTIHCYQVLRDVLIQKQLLFHSFASKSKEKGKVSGCWRAKKGPTNSGLGNLGVRLEKFYDDLCYWKFSKAKYKKNFIHNCEASSNSKSITPNISVAINKAGKNLQIAFHFLQ